ncbi:YicC/YloC family endoribonuclease [Aestuariirhabdus litorea]|uniref:YicC family protein n=1 Tax=Aestuariirhabdus litorea TaxID=2528527 RepID=A0A3P3VIH8_9GAMM|nr:YicC/YloC family endoribonuclease [Aestuariirhabdus litorea]RRJ82535.1 YicC family protein [Aestuariirhabdus litorea]RWW92696.1 YicC family protein [Endozoicomonadaceae bacterium GTF-13]
MTSSMTAFARQEAQFEWGSLAWEIRSVNHRYLEPSFRLPEALRELEFPLREQLRKRLTRGKVECSLRYQIAAGVAGELVVNSDMCDQLQKALKQVQASFYDCALPDPLALLQWPGVLQQQEFDMKQVHGDALGVFNQALAQLIEGREREGAELRDFIEQRLKGVADEAEQVRTLMPEILERQRQRMQQRIEEAGVELDPGRLEQEMVLITQRSDVEEELDRLQVHITEVSRVLKSGGAIGRRLDFLMQELNREANTLGSKSINAGTTQIAVNLKVLIEQMREQIQNIE